MYDFLDQPADRLGRGSRFLLWAMRGWTMMASKRHCAPAALAPAFATLGVLPALPDLHIAMAFLHKHTAETLTLASITYERIVDDEALLLGLWRDIAGGDRHRACATLQLMVEAESVEPILETMAEANAKLAAMDLAPTGLATDAEAAGR